MAPMLAPHRPAPPSSNNCISKDPDSRRSRSVCYPVHRISCQTSRRGPESIQLNRLQVPGPDLVPTRPGSPTG
ncbi:hypothetical protein ACFX2K_014796 [Malus domestica]